MPEDSTPKPQARQITSMELSRRTIAACWALGIAAVSAGGVATFVRQNQAGTAALIVLGSGLILIALMRRIPLRLEVGGTKLDASYESDLAYDAGREGGVVRGLELALDDLREVSEGNSTAVARVQGELDRLTAPEPSAYDPPPIAPEGVGYRGPTACSAARITYRQLDYWERTRLVVPSVAQPGKGARLYSFRDIVILRLVKRLLDTGISLQNIRTVVEGLPASSNEMPGLTVVSDGESVYLCSSAKDVIDLVESGRGLFAISLGRVVAEIQAVLQELPAEPIHRT